jgi:DNA-binding transcriptional LysR family regulator
MIQRVFDQHHTRLRIVAELWSFENIKGFVREDVGLAIVPGVTVREELQHGLLVRIPVRDLEIPRRTLMIYREQGYVSDSALELIKLVRSFSWDRHHRDSLRPAAGDLPRASNRESRGPRPIRTRA